MYAMTETATGLRYWSVYDQRWVTVRCRHEVPARELAAMPAEDRARVALLPLNEEV